MERKKIDWLLLETTIRGLLENFQTDQELGIKGTAEATIFAIDEAIALHTGRGHSIKGENDW